MDRLSQKIKAELENIEEVFHEMPLTLTYPIYQLWN